MAKERFERLADRIKTLRLEAIEAETGWTITINAIEKLEEAEEALRYAARKTYEP